MQKYPILIFMLESMFKLKTIIIDIENEFTNIVN